MFYIIRFQIVITIEYARKQYKQQSPLYLCGEDWS